jgi:hypothetical protein
MKKHFKIKHKILQILAQFEDSFPFGAMANDRLIHYSEIERKISNVDKIYLLDILQSLTSAKEIYCSMEFDNSKFLILQDGKAAYIENKYLSLGRKELRDRIFDILRIASTVILLLIAIITFVQNIFETKQNSREIEKIRNEIQKMNPKPVLQTDKY